MNQQQRLAMHNILFTDQYQLTMAQLYFRMGMHERTAQFDHFYRRNPDYGSHQAGYCVAAGLSWLLEWMSEARFGDADIEYLRSQRTGGGKPLFADDFLAWLRQYGNFEGLSMLAIPEGRVVHPQLPLTIVQGPLAMAQILETPLLNMLNYQTLIATKAARIVESGRGRPVLEFGLRRAQGDGANAGARAALIGGASFTSNVALSREVGLPAKGTHAHSMVQLYTALGMGELEAFRSYAEIYPDDCLFLVDTINTLESGVPNAIKVFEEITQRGHRPVGIRLDSGDLAYLSIQAAKLLNQAGFSDTSIVLSGDLDELVIWQILTQISEEAPRYSVDADQLINRLVFGVGTRLITSWGDPALGGVFKLVAVRDGDRWASAIKLSETPAKIPNPGQKRAWRIYDQRSKATADLITLDDEIPGDAKQLLFRHPTDHSKFRTMSTASISRIEPLLSEVWKHGKIEGHTPTIEEIRQRRQNDVDLLDPGIRRLVNPHIYHVSLSEALWKLRQETIAAATLPSI